MSPSTHARTCRSTLSSQPLIAGPPRSSLEGNLVVGRDGGDRLHALHRNVRAGKLAGRKRVAETRLQVGVDVRLARLGIDLLAGLDLDLDRDVHHRVPNLRARANLREAELVAVDRDAERLEIPFQEGQAELDLVGRALRL